MQTLTQATKRFLGALFAAIMLTAGALVFAQPAEAATWRYVKKSSGNGCIELLTNGTFYKLTSVCNGARNYAAPYTTYYINGQKITMCIPKGTSVGLGIRSEFYWGGTDSGVSGCALDGDRDGKIDPYRLY